MKGILLFLLCITVFSLECGVDKVHVTVTRITKMYASEESLYVYSGSSTTGTPVFQLIGSTPAATPDFCITPGVVTLLMKDSYGDGWSSGSTVTFTVGSKQYGPFAIPAHSGSRSYTQQVEEFNLITFVNYGEAWKYTNQAQTGDVWKTASVDWTETSSYPSVSQITRYFQKTYTMNQGEAWGISFTVKTNSGFIAYLNGHEVFSWGMPTENVTPTTYALESANVTARTISTLFNLIDVTPSTTYILAVEMHAHASTMDMAECFDAKMELLMGERSYRIEGGSFTGVPEGYNNEGFANLYDDTPSTKWCFEHFTGDVATTTYTWGDGRRELINQYSFTTANDAYDRDPNKWRVYGSNNDGQTWLLLDARQNIEMTTARLTKVYFDILNFTPFASYKFELLDKRSTLHTLQIGDIGLYMRPTNVTAMELSYPETVFNLNRFVDEMAALPNYAALFNNWSIQGPNQASLPAGIVFDTITGAIQGIPSVNMETTVYTITAVSIVDGLSHSATVSITVTGCDLPNNMYVFFSKYNSYNTNEMFEVRNAEGALIHQHVPSIEHPVGYCLPVGKYTVRLYTTNGNVWAADSTFTAKAVIVGSQLILAQTRLQNDAEKSFVLSIMYPLPPVAYNTNYKYLVDGTVPAGWNTASFSDASWTTLSDTARPTSTSAVMLYRNTFTVSSLESMHGFELLVKARAGMVVYLNGNEIFRTNVVGDVTSTSTAIAGSVNAKWIMVTGCASRLQAGSNTIAVAIVNINANSHVVDFDMSMRLMGESTNIPRYFEFNSPDDAYELFDNNLNTNINLSASSPKNGTIMFAADRYEVVNEYCFYTTNNNPNNDPRDWILSGTPDGLNWEVIDTQSNVFFMTRQYQYCFFLPNQHTAYNGYRLTLTATAGGDHFMLSSLELFLENLAALVLPELSFEPSAIVGYINTPLPQSSASSDYYTFYTIAPALPEGFTLNTSTGGIYGSSAVEIPLTTYTISALNQLGETKSTTVTLNVIPCTGDKTFFTMEFYMSSQASKCSYELKDSKTGVTVSSRSAFINNVDVIIPFCTAASQYSLILRSTGTSGWGSNMVYIRLADNSLLLKESLAAGASEKTYPFNAAYAISPKYSEWNYSVDGSEVPSNWNTVEGAPATWPAAKSGSFPTSTAISQYYYKKFEATGLSDYAVLEMSCIFRAGVIVYINGVEVLRKNLPEETDRYTQALEENMNPEQLWVSELVQRGILVEGTNILAFELHRSITAEEVNSFDGSAWFVMDGMYMMTNGEGTTDPSSTGNEGSDKAFDNNSSTKFYNGEKCVGTEFKYTYTKNRYEALTNYGVVSAGDCNIRHPSGWVLEGSNDNENWDPLQQKSGQLFTEYHQQIRHSFYNDKAYNVYRLTITECANSNFVASSWCNPDTIQLSDFYLFAKRIDGLCPMDGEFKPAMNGDRSYADCPRLYEGARYRLCTDGVFGEEYNGCLPAQPERVSVFNREYILYRKKAMEPIVPNIVAVEYTVSVLPALPQGLTLDSATGVISGTPLVNQETTHYSITASTVGGHKTVVITIAVVDAPINWNLIAIVTVLAVVIVMVLVALILGMKKGGAAKPGKKMKKQAKVKPKTETKEQPKKTIKI